MKFDLKFLGIGSGFESALGNTSAFFTDSDNNLYLIDCGFDVFTKLKNFRLLEEFNNITVFLTHLHDDHVGSLGSLIFYCYFNLNKKITVRFPSSDLAMLLKVQGALRFVNFMITKHGTIESGKKTILEYEFISTPHDPAIPCFGIKIKNTDIDTPQQIYYSGDTKVLFNGLTKFDDIYTMPFIEIFQDCSYEKTYEGAQHMSLDLLCRAIPPKHRNIVKCMHLVSCTPQQILDKGFRLPQLYVFE